jgi:hypothetical protein
MKQLLLMCCLMVVTSVCSYAQTNPVSQPNFLARVSQLNTNISQNDMVAAQATWGDLTTMMTLDQEYIKSRLADAVQNEDPGGQNTFSARADLQATNYSEAFRLIDDMVLNQNALISRLNQYGVNIQ